LRRIACGTLGGAIFVSLNFGDDAALDNDALVRGTGLARDDPGDVLECQALLGRDKRRGRKTTTAIVIPRAAITNTKARRIRMNSFIVYEV
jgi:hypothetical protein